MRLPVVRIKRADVIDAFHDRGPSTRSELETLFRLRRGKTSIQTHITAMREDATIYICDWRPPEKTGMWTPVYDLRTSANEQDKPHPPPRDRYRKVAEVPEDIGEPVVLRGVGIKKEHALMARARSQAMGLGLWGDLLLSAR
jgi:hypothetical protein